MRPELSMMTKTKWIAVALILGAINFFGMGIDATTSSSRPANLPEFMPYEEQKSKETKTAMYFGFTAGIVLAVAGVMVWRIE